MLRTVAMAIVNFSILRAMSKQGIFASQKEYTSS